MLSTASSNSIVLPAFLPQKPGSSSGAAGLTLPKSLATLTPPNVQAPPRVEVNPSAATTKTVTLPPIIPRQRKNGKHLVLDLDETLVHTFEDMNSAGEFSELIEHDEAKMANFYSIDFPGGDTMFGYIRPFADYFLDVAFNEFESVGVWSAGTKFYVEMIVKIVFKDRPLKFVMSRSDCDELRVKTEDIPCRFKPLANIYKDHPGHTPSNTLIVDDRRDVCALNCINNVVIPEFLINAANAPLLFKDQSLLILAKWFQTEQFRNTPDVRALKSHSPFKI